MPGRAKLSETGKHIPLSFWLLTGGTGPPPTEESFYRRAAERKAAHRRQVHIARARKQAIAELEDVYGPITLGSKLTAHRAGGSDRAGKEKKTVRREELMERYGPETGTGVGWRPRAGRSTKAELGSAGPPAQASAAATAAAPQPEAGASRAAAEHAAGGNTWDDGGGEAQDMPRGGGPTQAARSQHGDVIGTGETDTE